jgi:sulfur-oxidizing protein SoxX
MHLKRATAALISAVLISVAGSAMAGPVAPGDVKFDDYAVKTSLTGAPGDPEAGAKVFKDKKLGNCLACHENSAMKNELFQGNVGPSLSGIGKRRAPDQIRAIVVNSKAVFGPDTVMPGFYSLEVGADVRKDLVGKTILSAEQVEDVVAYLSSLK